MFFISHAHVKNWIKIKSYKFTLSLQSLWRVDIASFAHIFISLLWGQNNNHCHNIETKYLSIYWGTWKQSEYMYGFVTNLYNKADRINKMNMNFWVIWNLILGDIRNYITLLRYKFEWNIIFESARNYIILARYKFEQL